MTEAALKSSIFSLQDAPVISGVCSHPPPFLGSDCDVVHFLLVMGQQLGFCFLLSGYRKPDEVRGKELLSGSHVTGWLMQVCLGSLPARPGGRRGERGHRTGVQMCWLVPTLSTAKTFRERRAREVLGTQAHGKPTDPRECFQDSQGSDTEDWGASAEQRQPGTATGLVFILPGLAGARAVWGCACLTSCTAQLIEVGHSALQIP